MNSSIHRPELRSPEYRIEVDRITPSDWSEALRQFDDANLYQTWAFGAVRWGETRLSHLVLKRTNAIVAMAQIFVIQPLGFRMGIAHLRWGPVCQVAGQPIDPEILGMTSASLHAEYVKKRGLFLRVFPHACLHTERGSAFQTAYSRYTQEGFAENESYRTFRVNLTPPLDQIRKRLDQKWRNQLNRAERNELTTRDGESSDFFNTFFMLYDQMLARKRFSSSDVRQFSRIQQGLKAQERMRVFICEQGGIPVAALVGTGIGDTGIYLLGATNDEGMKCKAAYLLQWRMVQWLKERGVTWYDLGGINPEKNPGVHHFKKGLGGDDALYLPPFTACNNLASRAFAFGLDSVRGKRRRTVYPPSGTWKITE